MGINKFVRIGGEWEEATIPIYRCLHCKNTIMAFDVPEWKFCPHCSVQWSGEAGPNVKRDAIRALMGKRLLSKTNQLNKPRWIFVRSQDGCSLDERSFNVTAKEAYEILRRRRRFPIVNDDWKLRYTPPFEKEILPLP